MNTAWLVTNASASSTKFREIYAMLIAAGARQGLVLEAVTNAEAIARAAAAAKLPSYAVFWDKDIRAARYLENAGIRLFNTAAAIEACDDKFLTYARLVPYGIAMPQTLPVPKTWAPPDWTGSPFTAQAGETLGFPLVVKECFGSFGQQVSLARNRAELEGILNRIAMRPALLQQYIPSSKGRDIRIQVVGGEVIAAMRRQSDTDFRANLTNGGRAYPYTPTLAQAEMATEVCRLLHLDFAGVDILFGAGEEPILCEVNSNAHFKNLYDCTGVNTADAIAAHLIRSMNKQ
ncbi:MAG: RimK family alpha-L-glutamate ligase [Oscillospiraceae bacterium]|nr:RimK family alpha-L-glutamate ligase [Oscillospiraceae bacterium]